MASQVGAGVWCASSMITRSAGGGAILSRRTARACRVAIEATCTSISGRCGRPAISMPGVTPAAFTLSTVWLMISRRWASTSTLRWAVTSRPMVSAKTIVLPAPVGRTANTRRTSRQASSMRSRIPAW